jgi:hypothetical protein
VREYGHNPVTDAGHRMINTHEKFAALRGCPHQHTWMGINARSRIRALTEDGWDRYPGWWWCRHSWCLRARSTSNPRKYPVGLYIDRLCTMMNLTGKHGHGIRITAVQVDRKCTYLSSQRRKRRPSLQRCSLRSKSRRWWSGRRIPGYIQV